MTTSVTADEISKRADLDHAVEALRAARVRLDNAGEFLPAMRLGAIIRDLEFKQGRPPFALTTRSGQR